MASERTPLLGSNTHQFNEVHQHSVYDRFSPLQKRTIVSLVSLAGVSPLLISESFIPSVPNIAKDLHTTGSIVNFSIGLSIFATALGSLIWATYSGYYGRRPIYLVSLTIQCICNLGVASVQTVPQLLIWRMLQAFGASSGGSVGIGVISDIYELEERGTASGIFFAGVLLGPVLAPVIGGVVAHYSSWRVMQYGLAAFALFSLVLTFLLQPETSHPGTRGIDRAISAYDKRWWVWLNPFKCLGLLRSPNIFLLSVACTLALLTDQFILIPIPFTIAASYGITNEALIGALCIPVGLGNLVGSPLSGFLSDRSLAAWRKRRGGCWVPEDRLRATVPGSLVLVPMSILLCGLVTHYVDGVLGLFLNCLCLFMNGLGVDFIYTPSASYNVDILHDRSAQVSAANMAFQQLMMSITVSGVLPMIHAFGLVTTYSIVAAVSWLPFILIWAIIRYGDEMRAYVDLGFSNEDG